MRSPTLATVRFGPFEVRPATRELFRNGMRVRLPPQAFEVLRLLLERRGELVNRQEFHRVLWPADTFVDFDQGLNNAIKRLREVLNDSADSPRYIETLPRLGYRFIGSVEVEEPASAKPAGTERSVPASAPNPPVAVESAETAKAPARRMPLAKPLLVVAAAIVLLALAWRLRPGYPPPRITGVTQLTTDGVPKWGALATDGLRVYFTEVVNGQPEISAVPVSGGAAVPLKMPFPHSTFFGISSDKNDLLVAEASHLVEDAPLWRVPIIGGTPRRLGSAAGHDASWSPDETRLAYVIGGSVFVANGDGSDPHKLVGPRPDDDEWAWRPTWSSDGRRLRFEYYQMQLHSAHVWEVNADGTNLHPLTSVSSGSRMQAFGEWSSGDRYFLFSAWDDLESSLPWPASNLWALREKSDLLHRPSRSPTSLTTGPNRYYSHVLSLDGKSIFVLSLHKHGELMRYDAGIKTFVPWLSALSAEGVSFSRDGAWVAYVTYPQGELWRSRLDGSQALRLTSRPLFVSSPVWSPDGTQIAFSAMQVGEPGRAWSVSAEGGDPRPIAAIARGGDAAWTPDGNSLVYLDASNGDSDTVIRIRNLKTGAVASVAGSHGVWGPRMSPDGRWIAALSNNLSKLLLFDLQTQSSRELASANMVTWPTWTADSKSIFFARADPDPAIERVSVSGGAPVPILVLNGYRTTGVGPSWFSLTPAGDILLLHDTGGGTEIYALSWDAP